MTVDEKKWFVIHVLSGHEKKIKTYLENEIETLGLSDKIATILIPSEEVTEMKNGKKKVKNKIFFPGYMLVECIMDNDVKHLITSTPGVTNFVGAKNEPQPLRGDEIERILGRVDESRHRQTIDVPFREGDPIKVVDGPFTDFTGFVKEVNHEKNKLKVMVSIFGRATPVELDFLQVELEK